MLSDRIEKSENEAFASNGVTRYAEAGIGSDGMVDTHSKGAPKKTIPRQQLWPVMVKQVARGGVGGAPQVDNPCRGWREIDSPLSDVAIEVLGPSPTRDSISALEVALHL